MYDILSITVEENKAFHVDPALATDNWALLRIQELFSDLLMGVIERFHSVPDRPKLFRSMKGVSMGKT
ncbi:MAG: hypothetical protein ACETWB_02985 [Anaerolineae bacterium]